MLNSPKGRVAALLEPYRFCTRMYICSWLRRSAGRPPWNPSLAGVRPKPAVTIGSAVSLTTEPLRAATGTRKVWSVGPISCSGLPACWSSSVASSAPLTPCTEYGAWPAATEASRATPPARTSSPAGPRAGAPSAAFSATVPVDGSTSTTVWPTEASSSGASPARDTLSCSSVTSASVPPAALTTAASVAACAASPSNWTVSTALLADTAFDAAASLPFSPLPQAASTASIAALTVH